MPRAAFGIDQSAQVVKAISGDQTPCDEFPQASFNFGFELAAAADNVGKERSSAGAQELQDFARDWTQALNLGFRFLMRCAHAGQRHPFRLVADKKCDGRNAGRHHAAPASG